MRRHDADDGACDTIDRSRAAHDRGITAEATLPQSVADDKDARRIANILIAREAPPEQRFHAERGKEVLGRSNHAQPLRSVAARQRAVVLRVRGQRLEAAQLCDGSRESRGSDASQCGGSCPNDTTRSACG